MKDSPWWMGPAAIAAAVVLVLVSWWDQRPPSPLAADAPLEVFAAGRALEVLQHIAVRPHMTGSAEHEQVREYLVDTLTSLGFETEVQQATVAQRRGRIIRSATVRNIVARKRGTDSTGGVAITSHYDSQQLPDGAGDDGSGVAATLEALRALNAGAPLRNDLYVFITDAEELGLLGAVALVNEHRWWDEVDLLLNFEARGSAGQSVMFETNDDNGWVVGEFAAADPYPTGSSLYYEVYRRLPNDTDFSVYKSAGVTGLNFAIAEGADVYHRPTDSIANLSMGSLQHHGEHALAMARRFGGVDLAGRQTTSGDVVFFAFPGLGMLRYPFAWVGVITILTLMFAAAVVERAFRARRVTPLGALVGLVIALAAVGLSAGLGWLLWRVVQGAHHELGSIQGRALYSEGWYGAAIGSLTLAVVASFLYVARTFAALASLVAGALLLPLALALLAWWYAPGVSMLFVWPVLMGSGALCYVAARKDTEPYRVSELAVVVVLSAPTIFILFPLVWTIFQGLNISVAPLIAGIAALMLLLLLPLLDMAARPNRVWLPATAAGLAIAFTAIGLVDARPGPSRPVPSDLVYALDREQGAAVWATMQRGDDGWVEGFVGPDAESLDLASFLGGNPRPYRRAPAPLMEAPDAAVRIVEDVVETGVRRVRLEIESAIAPELLNLSSGSGSGVSLTAINGTPLPPQLDAGTGVPWLLQHYGQPPDGVLTVDVEAPLDVAFELVLVEFVMRLPPLAGVDTERPPGWTPHARRLTDVSMFRQVIRVQ